MTAPCGAAVRIVCEQDWGSDARACVLPDRSAAVRGLLGDRSLVASVWNARDSLDDLEERHLPPHLRLIVAGHAVPEADTLAALSAAFGEDPPPHTLVLYSPDELGPPPAVASCFLLQVAGDRKLGPLVSRSLIGGEAATAMTGLLGSLFRQQAICFDLVDLLSLMPKGGCGVFASASAQGRNSGELATRLAINQLEAPLAELPPTSALLCLAVGSEFTLGDGENALEHLASAIEAATPYILMACWCVKGDPSAVTAYLYVVSSPRRSAAEPPPPHA